MSDKDYEPWRGDEQVARQPGADPPPETSPPETSPPPPESSPSFSETAAVSAESSVASAASAHPGSRPGAPLRVSNTVCPNCGYNLTGATIGMGCPECGMIVGVGLLGAHSLPTSGKAVAAMVLGILSILGCMSYGLFSIVCGPLAILFALQAKGQSRRGEVSPSSEGMATAGLVCGIIGTVIGGVALLVFGGFFAAMILSAP